MLVFAILLRTRAASDFSSNSCFFPKIRFTCGDIVNHDLSIPRLTLGPPKKQHVNNHQCDMVWSKQTRIRTSLSPEYITILIGRCVVLHVMNASTLTALPLSRGREKVCKDSPTIAFPCRCAMQMCERWETPMTGGADLLDMQLVTSGSNIAV